MCVRDRERVCVCVCVCVCEKECVCVRERVCEWFVYLFINVTAYGKALQLSCLKECYKRIN